MTTTCLAEDRIAGPLKWHGGKAAFAGKLAKWIVGLMPPDHVHYVEPYFGGGSVMLFKNPNNVSEVANDLHGGLTNFWRVLQDQEGFQHFLRTMQAIPFSQEEWNRSGSAPWDCSLDDAVAFFVRCRQSLAGRMESFAPLSKSRTRGGMNEQVSAWLSAVEGLPLVHERLKRVAITNKPALEVINAEDSPDTLFYLDPPYMHETRVTTGDYEHEMSADNHDDLLLMLSQIEGQFVLSGYRSQLYDDYAANHQWHRYDFDIANNAASGTTKRTMTESVWCNFSPVVP